MSMKKRGEDRDRGTRQSEEKRENVVEEEKQSRRPWTM